MSYSIHAFGQQFPITLDQLSKSRFLLDHGLDLDLDPELYPAFLEIYNYLTHPNRIQVTTKNYYNLLKLAAFLGIEELEDYLNSIIVIHAFNKDYIIPKSSIRKSKFLEAATRGYFKESFDTIELNLDPELESAFDLVVDYLNDVKILPVSLVGEVLVIADYLIIDDLIKLVLDEINPKDLPLILLNYGYIPQVAKLGASVFKERGYYLSEYSKKFQQLVAELDSDLNHLPIVFKPGGFLTTDNSKFMNLMAKGWASKCQKHDRPEIIRDINDISNGVSFSYWNGHYIKCPGNKSLVTEPYPCCSGTNKSQKWPDRKAIMTTSGWVVLVPKKYHGDFIVLWDPIILTDKHIIIENY